MCARKTSAAQSARSAETPIDLGLTANQCATACMACAAMGHGEMEAAGVLLGILAPTVTKSSQSARA